MTTILLVEDHTSTRDLWRRQLQVAGWEVLDAASLNSGLNQVDGADILVLDWHLGEQTGDILLDTWVSKGNGPAMIISGYDIPEGVFERGAWNVLPKPIVPEAFLTIIRRYCQYVKLEQTVDQLSIDVKRLKQYLVLSIFAAVGLTKIPWLEIFQSFF